MWFLTDAPQHRLQDAGTAAAVRRQRVGKPAPAPKQADEGAGGARSRTLAGLGLLALAALLLLGGPALNKAPAPATLPAAEDGAPAETQAVKEEPLPGE
jgi:hypothetical protein